MKKKDYIECGMTIKAVDDTGSIAGYGSVFGVEDSYNHIVAKGAFAASLKKRKPVMLWQHDWNSPIGTYSEVLEDDSGLAFKGEIITETSLGRDAHILAKKGAVTGMSIGGYIGDDYSYDKKTGVLTINSFDLYEISLVTFPANDAARIQTVKTIDDALSSVVDLKSAEAYLRDAGMTRSEATAFVSHFKKMTQREAVANDALVAAIKNRHSLMSKLGAST